MFDSLIGSSPYLGIFIALCLAGVGLPLPEEIVVVTAGVLSHQGVMRWWLALPICLLGVALGDVILYWIGRHFGERALALPIIRHALDPARRDRLEAAYRQRGALIVFGARHVAGLRGAAFLTAGIVHLPFWKFLLADGIAIAYGIPLSFGLAYFFSAHVHRLMAEVHRVELWIALVAALVAVVWIVRAMRRRGRQVVGEEPASAA